METLKLLKQCRILRRAAPVENTTTATKTIVVTTTTISPDFSDGEAESYFDLEFPLTSNDNTNEEEEEEDDEDDEISFSSEDFSDDDDENEEESSNDDENVKLSPSNELIVSRNSIHLDSSTIFFEKETEDNSKSPVSSLKSPSKFQFLLLKLKKQKPTDRIVENAENMEKNEKSGNSLFAVYKLKVEEMKLPLVSLFTTRDNNCSKQIQVDDVECLDSNAGCDEKKLTKEMMQKYLKIVKPLYVQLTKNYMRRIKLSGHLTFPKGSGSESTPCSVTTEKANQKQGNNSIKNLQTGLKIVKKQLGKSRSDSAIVAVSQRGKVAGSCDDSMVQVQDGIQGAILHCKKSLSSSKI